MALTFSLIERTPYRLRYLVTAGGVPGGVPTDSGILVNRDGPTPDLRGDAKVFLGSPIWNLVSINPITDVTEARRFIFGDGLSAAPGAVQSQPTPLNTEQLQVPRAHVYITAKTRTAGDPQWAVDAINGAAVDAQSTGYVVLVVTGSPTQGQLAYLDIDFQHTFDR